jgi:hypothetical protein
MTEDEAKSKWCPFGRVGHRDGMALNDPNLPNFSVRCHGSACMAWRRDPSHYEHGFCGLAGVPTP